MGLVCLPSTSARDRGSPLSNLQPVPYPCHICTGMGLAAATSASGLDSPRRSVRICEQARNGKAIRGIGPMGTRPSGEGAWSAQQERVAVPQLRVRGRRRGWRCNMRTRSLQHATRHVQHSARDAQRTVCNVQQCARPKDATCSVLHATCKLQHACRMQRTRYRNQEAARSMQHTT